MNHENFSGRRYLLFFGLVFFIVIFIFGILSITEKVRRFSPAQPELTVDPISTSTLRVSVRVINTECLDAEKIDYSLVELSAGGGVPPYELTITNSESELYGPYPIMGDDLPVRIKVYGGDHFTAIVRSGAGRVWSGTIGLPAEAEICEITPTPTLEPTITEIIIDTPILTNTEVIGPSPTFTPTVNTPFNPRVTDTKKPGSAKTNAPPPQPTNTPPPQPTNTPPPQPTNTPPPQPTNTPPPQSTNTPPHQPTNTSPPQLTNTPPPQPTPTPINPHPKECEDGKDNDNDGLIDMKDPQCKRPSDPKEDK